MVMKTERTEDLTGLESKPGPRSVLETTLRAATAIIVFGIPLAVGTATVFSYGAYRIYKRLAGNLKKNSQKK
jgi:hypothetical protein